NPAVGSVTSGFAPQALTGVAGTFTLTLAQGQAVALSWYGPTGLPPLSGSTLPRPFLDNLGPSAFVTFTDPNRQYPLPRPPAGQYYVQVGGFSAASGPLGATGNLVVPAPAQNQSFAYIGFTNSEVEAVQVNANETATAPLICMTPVGPIYEVGVVSGPSGPING